YLVLGEGRVRVLAETVSQRSGMSFLVGIGVWVALLILSALLPTGMFGVPGSETVGTLAFFVIAATGYTGISLWVGRGLLRSVSPLTAALVGALLITVIQLIPIVGWLLWIIFGWMALGAAVLSGFGSSVDWMLR